MAVVHLLERTLLAATALLATTSLVPVDARPVIQDAIPEVDDGGFLSMVGSSRKLLHGCHKSSCQQFCPRCKFPRGSDFGHCKKNKRMFVCARRGGNQGNEGNEGDEGNEGNEGNSGPPNPNAAAAGKWDDKPAAATPAKRRAAAQRSTKLPNPAFQEPTYYKEFADYSIEQGPEVFVYSESYDFEAEHEMGDEEEEEEDIDADAPAPAPAAAPVPAPAPARNSGAASPPKQGPTAKATATGGEAQTTAAVENTTRVVKSKGVSREEYMEEEVEKEE